MWQLFDLREPLWGDDEEFPATVIHDEAELRRELEHCRARDPGMHTLESSCGDVLSIGLGGPYGVVRWPTKYGGPLKTAYTNTIHTNTLVEFTEEGIGNPFCPENLLLADEAIEIVVYFFKIRKLADWVRWGPRVWPKAEYVQREAVWQLLSARDSLGTSIYTMEFPVADVPDEETLRRVLSACRAGDPSILILRSPEGDALHLGLRGPYGAVQWAPSDRENPTKIAYANVIQADAPVGFLQEGRKEELPPENRLPAEQVIEIAIHFFKKHELAEWVKWGPRS